MSLSLQQALRIFQTPEGERLAGALFRKRFHAPFPVPRDRCGLPIPTPPEAWRQYVAVYGWPDGREETVGFLNWIRYGDVYLAGGMCVGAMFYRHLPREHLSAVRDQGGIAQMMLAKSHAELIDCAAWFGHCGDAKAMAVSLRAGYERTVHPHVIVKWRMALPEAERRRLADAVARIGPF
jgi:hypothetical protein